MVRQSNVRRDVQAPAVLGGGVQLVSIVALREAGAGVNDALALQDL